MTNLRLTSLLILAAATVGLCGQPGSEARAQSAAQPTNSLPNPYRSGEVWDKMPAGRAMGSTNTISIDSNGHIWGFERCGANTCAGSSAAPILEFDASGKVIKSFGAGMFVFPHCVYVDQAGNVWVADALGANGKGQQVIKFSPDGKVLMKLGTAGVAGTGPDTLNQPSAVVVAADGSIFCRGRTRRRSPTRGS